ncbi:MAG: hypothetical protein B6D59_01215 [Campylobacteraceae bacterium 4484_4]|nr:MAG: hypothetical protein B6D59_01215 [Campylobacteraceae bacterium 4484_4]
MIPLVEHFYSFQGEGKYAGTPSIFIRFGGCNLGCPGFNVESISPKDGSRLLGCDSIRAVKEAHFEEQWQKLTSSDELITIIKSYLKNLSFKPDIVFTGGEPLLYHQDPVLLETLEYFISRSHNVTIETNATILIDFDRYPIYKKITFAMSVKLSNSGEPYEKRIRPDTIRAICTHTKDSFFKFVLSKESLYESAKEIEEIRRLCPDIPVYCMPMGATAGELAKNDRAVAEFCIRHGYRYIDRMHIRLWDNEEGR